MKEAASITRYETCSEIKKPQQQQEHEQEHEHQHPPFPVCSWVPLSLVQHLAFQSGSRLAGIAGAQSRPHELGVASPPPWAGRLRDRSVAGPAGMYQPASGQRHSDLAGAQPYQTLPPKTALILKLGATLLTRAADMRPQAPQREREPR
jgi:hypothetical protein